MQPRFPRCFVGPVMISGQYEVDFSRLSWAAEVPPDAIALTGSSSTRIASLRHHGCPACWQTGRWSDWASESLENGFGQLGRMRGPRLLACCSEQNREIERCQLGGVVHRRFPFLRALGALLSTGMGAAGQRFCLLAGR